MRPQNLPSSFPWAVWLMAARPKTLTAGACPVLLGTAMAWHADSMKFWPALLCLFFALFAQIAANYANDYYDHAKGADSPQRIGFTRVVASGLVSPWAMQKAMFLVLGIAFALGLMLLPYGGWHLFIVGLLCLAAAFFYTAGPKPLAYIGLGDVAVVLFFGIIAVNYTYYVQVGKFALDVLFVSLAVGLLADNILLVNNIRDRKTDRETGKWTLPARFGKRFGVQMFTLNLSVAFGVPLFLAIVHVSMAYLIPLLLLPVGLYQAVQIYQTPTSPVFNRILAQTSQFLLIYTGLMTLGIILS